MTQNKKSSTGKRKRSDKRFSVNHQQRHWEKENPSKAKPGNIELNESTLIDERDAPTINPNKVTRT